MKVKSLILIIIIIGLFFSSRWSLGLKINSLEEIGGVIPAFPGSAPDKGGEVDFSYPPSLIQKNSEETPQEIEWRSNFRSDTPWEVIYRAIQSKWGRGLGEWEKAFMGAIYLAEGGSFGCAGEDLQDEAENCAATIKNSIQRFWRNFSQLDLNSERFDSEKAAKFGRALIATICIEHFRLGEAVASQLFDPLLGLNLLSQLAPNFISLLDGGGEPNTGLEVPARKAYVDFLMKFLPQNWDQLLSGETALPSGITDPYIMIANSFYQNFLNSDDKEQFLIFSSFIFPYIGMDIGTHASGYCPIWDMRGGTWRGAWAGRSPDEFELNTNWGMNVYRTLSYYFDFNPLLPFPLDIQSYFLSTRPFYKI